MNKVSLFYFVLIATTCLRTQAQVGIATTVPAAQLDIRSSNQSAPSQTDGILIPKVDAFAAVNPTAAQQGMLVYLNVAATGKPVGFYYWDFPTLGWIGISTVINSDKDWLESATGLGPDDSNDDIYHLGNTAIGKVTPTVPLDIENTTKTSNILNTANFSNTLSTLRAGLSNAISATSSTDAIAGVMQTLSGNSTSGNRYGMHNTFSGNPFGEFYGTYNNFLSTSLSTQYGTWNNFTSNSWGNRYGLYNTIGGNGGGYQFGVYSVFNNTGSGEQRGMQNTFNGPGGFGSSKYGVHNQMLGANDSSYYGTYNQMNSTGTGSKYGMFNDFSNGTGTKYGSFLMTSSTQTQYGMYNNMNILSGFGSNFGVYNVLTSAATSGGYQYGVYNSLSGTNTSDVAGTLNFIDNTGSGFGYHYGTSNVLSGLSDAWRYGVANNLNGNGNGTQIGTSNTLSGNGSGQHFGTQNLISGSGSAIQTGMFTHIYNTGNGDHYAVSSNMTGTGTGSHYGTYNTLSGTGTGNKYGVYSLIAPAAGGTHYGVYSIATKTGSYSGYFLGSMAIGTTIANTYTMPPSRGTNGQVMQTDGSGNVSWANPNSGMSLSRANLTTNQSLTTTGWQKINFNTESFDVNGDYNPAMGRFTALKAGYYRVNATFHTNSLASTDFYSIGVYKNGLLYQESSANHLNNGPVIRTINCVVPLAVGEYIEIYTQNYQSGVQIDSFAPKTFFEVEQIQ
ncbi:hypothetical protein [Flavobacterium sp.]|uniref:hypothetical protein n=1 Tax=Flavobacterium sp. TaxID=239 RepID=UPI0039E47162